ncbi:MAG: putative metalloprotease with PDZ domain [Polaribacter sp.]|jgi:predicted metalloprotease with PDZ domain
MKMKNLLVFALMTFALTQNINSQSKSNRELKTNNSNAIDDREEKKERLALTESKKFGKNQKIRATNTSKEAYLGIVVAHNDPEKILNKKYEIIPPKVSSKGLVIYSVIEGSEAEKSGLIKDDIITEISGQKILKPEDLKSFLKTSKLNENQVNVSVLRNGKIISFSLLLSIRPSKDKIREKQGLSKY